ncbi:beta-galactosidase [Arthrobacter sp. ISL-48]|uniref:beta-galactosidase n=1 Tax=Arthrobacter sp. ISL-48 TaxID=2819110 RepID=UPI001BEA1DC4|nr:beta-galactosidase [Arthrobacter sp. ISL-48]MBT2532741.1 beta-galactosidase [Arthrobacter sp. ISL-48]
MINFDTSPTSTPRRGLDSLTETLGLIHGADYNPEQWPAESWPEDIRLMQKAGINLATVGVFSWATLEPREGARDFGWLDHILDLLHDGGIRVCLATPTASPPPWLGHDYPETLPVDADGRTLWYGSRNQFSPSSARYRRAAAAITESLAERYANHPAVAMWHVGNELGQISYDDESALAFRVWLMRRHGSLEELNRAWGTTFWGQRYGSWDEIIPPRRAPYLVNPSQTLDFQRFTSDQLLSLYRAERDIIRRYDPASPITTNLMGFFRGADYFSLAKETDVVANDWYTDPADPKSHRLGSLTHDLCRGLSRGEPWLLIESATSAVNWREHNVAKEPGELRVDALSAIARGADGVCYFQFRQSSFGSERFHSAVVPLAGEQTRVFREVTELGNDLQSLRQLAGTPCEAKIAVLFDWDSWWAAEAPDTPTSRLEVVKQIQAYYEPLLRRGLAVEVVHPSADLGRYELVLAPSLFILGQRNAEALGTFVQHGGHLVVGPFSGVADGNGHLVPGRFPGVLADLLGVDGEEWLPLASPLRVKFGSQDPAEQTDPSWHASIWAEDLALREETAEAVAHFAEGRLEGKPAVVRNRKGEGSAWYIAADLPAEALDRVMVAVLDSTGIASPLDVPLPEPVEAVSRGGHLFLLNHSNLPQAVHLGWASVDLLSGADHGEQLTLPPYGALVLKEPDLGEPAHT